MFLLATEIDLVTLGSILTTLIAAFVTAAGGIWKASSVLFVWIKEQLEPIFLGHKVLVDNLNTEMPKVTQTLNALKETQIEQCKAQGRHADQMTELGESHKKTDEKLDKILTHLSNKDLPQ